jgi:two-component system chemotaxis response regulator CheY
MSKSHILVVDDEPNNQRILTYTLNKAGYDSVAAADGETALKLMVEAAFQLAILDVSMPVMDGITLLHHIRAMPQYTRLPIIILTGSGDDEERVRAEEIGIQGFLTKPASSRMVLDVVSSLLGPDAKD